MRRERQARCRCFVRLWQQLSGVQGELQLEEQQYFDEEAEADALEALLSAALGTHQVPKPTGVSV